MSARELSDEECDAIADDAYKSLPTPTPSLLIARRCLVRSIDRAAFAAGRAAGMEEAAKVCDTWAGMALAAQSVPPTSDMQNSINSNLRMTSIGPTDCAAVIRALAKGKAPPEGRECS